MPDRGTTCQRRISSPSPSSMTPSSTPSDTSVCWARRTRGCRNCGTELAIASTPVSAEHPDANALRISSTPTASVADGIVVDTGTTGCGRIRPTTMTSRYRGDKRERRHREDARGLGDSP